MSRKRWIRAAAFLAGIGAIVSLGMGVGKSPSEQSFPLSESWEMVKPTVPLHNGDLVFRHARGTISNMLRFFSRHDARYSHGGIISIEPQGIFVYHSLGGEGSPNQGIRRERLESFCSPEAVHSFGIYRFFKNDNQASVAVKEAKAAYARKVVFDNSYDMSTDSAVYCTEFLYKILVKATGDSNCIPLTSLPGITYVACDNFYFPDRASILYSHTYEEN